MSKGVAYVTKSKEYFQKPMTMITILGIACVPALYNISF